jgi:FixJ family two-component response regulator
MASCSMNAHETPARVFAELTNQTRKFHNATSVSGLPNKLIAAELGISEACTKVHRSQLMRKMRADSLPDLVRMADKIGFPARSNPEN